MPEIDTDSMDSEMESNDIAIIGMACRLPGAQNAKQFWSNLKGGEEALTELSDDELREAGVSERALEDPNYVKSGMFLKDMACFDAGFFGFNPQEARIMDPQHRHFLECAWETFEDAGYVPSKVEGSVGVYAGSGHNAYMPYNLLSNKELLDQVGFFLLRHTGNDKDFLSTRASYLFDLKGPSVNVQTACSTSLVAVHMAAQSLLSGECEMALAGGVTIELPHRQGYLYKDSEILSKDGHCRPFEQSSGGTVFGSGVGCVLLKRLDDALADGDNIHAIVKSSAINNDGANKVSYLAPSVDGQAAAIREAIEIADIDPASIGFIECHGTGTQMGDPIEVAALSQAYGLDNPRKQYCALGSVKSNIGHLDTAAGVAGMIKSIQSLKHGQIAPTLHFNAPNPAIDFASSPFYVNDRLRDWPSEAPRRAAVSSLGVGGTNAHVILEEPPASDGTDESNHSEHIISLSAKTESALNSAAKKMTAHLREASDGSLADIAYTLNVGRLACDHRLSIVAKSVQEAAEQLADLTVVAAAKTHVSSDVSLVFMLPGGGAQYSGMGVDLYESEPVYREAFDACLACLPNDFSARVRSLVFAPEAERELATKTLQTPTLTLTSLFATEYALAKLMFSWGAKPGAMIGHSMGENTAACLAGVLSLHDAMNLVYLRGQLFERAPEGGMLSIPLPLEEARQYMNEDLEIAAVNAPELCVATGPKQSLMALQQKLEQNDVQSTVVRINVAAHSRMLDEVLEDFRAYLKSIKLSAPTIPFTSNLTGTWITDEQAMSPDYWVDHLRSTVKFAENIETVSSQERRVFVEIGPGKTLTNLAMANLEVGYSVMSSMRHPSEQASDCVVAKRTLGALWAHGAELDWSDYWREEYRFRVSLPTYSFEKKRHWVDALERTESYEQQELRKKKDIGDWYAKLAWRQSEVSGVALEGEADYLVFANDSDLSKALVDEIASAKLSCTLVNEGEVFEQTDEGVFVLSSTDESAFFALSEKVLDGSSKTLKLYYLWTVWGDSQLDESAQQNASFWGLFNLLKVVAEIDRPVELCVVSDSLYSLTGENITPHASLALGPVLVAERELPHVSARIVDMRSGKTAEVSRSARQLLRELSASSEFAQVLYRGRHRWVRDIEAISLNARVVKDKWLPEAATVLISGGLGGIGLTLARLFCQKGAKRIVLMSRRSFPERSQWPVLLTQLSETDALHAQISALQALDQSATEVSVVAADVTSRESMASALANNSIALDSISVVVHAAGMMDDKLLIEKTEAEARSVLSAKVEGAIALDQLLSENELDSFIVFSSVASYLGLPGQIDYTAANAFLDAFAMDRSERRAGKTIAINWSAWKEVGMAASVGKDTGLHRPVEASLLDSYQDKGTDGALYSVELDAQRDWLVAEHKTKDGFHLVPGTGFIELIRSACAHHLFGKANDEYAVVISELNFLSAFEVPAQGARTLNLLLTVDGDQIAVVCYAEEEESPLVTALVSRSNTTPRTFDIDQIMARCGENRPTLERRMDQVFMDFGPRWVCIESIAKGEHEALIRYRLPAKFQSDFETCLLHPALLDMATGCAQFLDENFDKTSDFYVPVSYENIEISGQMPEHFISHIRLRDNATDGQLNFDIDIADADGKVLVSVENFRMLKLSSGFATTLPETGDSLDESLLTPEQERLEAILREAILPQEGLEAFDRLMSVIEDDTQCAIASIDTALWQKQLRDQFGGLAENDELENAEPIHDADADPDIATVESALLENKGVEHAIVRSYLDDDGDRRLIAYYVPDDWEPVTVTELRNELSAKLSGALLPQQFVQLDEMPCNDLGEQDRTQLVDPFAPVDHYIAPNTQTEKRLEKIWQGVLGVSRVSLNENFFDIGGHSLLSIRVIVKVKKEFGVRLDQAKMVLLTLEQMASEIDENRQIETPKKPGSTSKTKATPETVATEVRDAAAVQTTDGENPKRGLFSRFKKGK